MTRRKSWWEKPLDELDREIRRLQNMVKKPDNYTQADYDDAKRRLSSLKAIAAGRRGTKPMFPLSGDNTGKKG